MLDQEVEGEASSLSGEVRGGLVGEEGVPQLHPGSEQSPVLPGPGPAVEPAQPLPHQRLGLELRPHGALLPHCSKSSREPGRIPPLRLHLLQPGGESEDREREVTGVRALLSYLLSPMCWTYRESP